MSGFLSVSPLYLSAFLSSRRGARLLVVFAIALLITAVVYALGNVTVNAFVWSQVPREASDKPVKNPITIQLDSHPSVLRIERAGGALSISELVEGNVRPAQLISRTCLPFRFVPILCPVRSSNSARGALSRLALFDKSSLARLSDAQLDAVQQTIERHLSVGDTYIENSALLWLGRVFNGTDKWGLIQFMTVVMLFTGMIQLSALRHLRREFEGVRTQAEVQRGLRLAAKEGTPRLALAVWSSSAAADVRTAIDDEVNGLVNWFWLQRYLVWLLPSLGFFGTVIGMGAGLGYIDEVSLGNEMQRADAMFSLGGALGTAFDTTLVGLVASILLKLRVERQLSECIASLQRAADTQKLLERDVTTRSDSRLYAGRTYSVSPVGLRWIAVLFRGVCIAGLLLVIVTALRSQ